MLKKLLTFLILTLICSCKEVTVSQGGGGISDEELKFVTTRMNILEERISKIESKLERNSLDLPIENDKKVEVEKSVK